MPTRDAPRTYSSRAEGGGCGRTKAMRRQSPRSENGLRLQPAFAAVRLMQLRESLTLAVQLKVRGLKERAEAIELQPCINMLTQDEWRILYLYANKRSRSYPKSYPAKYLRLNGHTKLFPSLVASAILSRDSFWFVFYVTAQIISPLFIGQLRYCIKN